MQFKCAPCTSNDSNANDTTTTACPEPRQCDRKCCHDTAPAAANTTTTCQPKTSEWPNPASPAPPLFCDCEKVNDAENWVEEDCIANDNQPSYRSPQRSRRLFSPVYPTKAKPKRKRQKKATRIGTDSGKPITSSKSFKEIEGNIEQNYENESSGVAGKPTALKSSPTTKKPGEVTAGRSKSSPTTKKPSGVTAGKSRTPPLRATTKQKFNSPRSSSLSKSPSPKFLYLKRRPNKKAPIDWKKPPKIPVKHTATSKVRNENWFADCGRYRIKAYRGDWENLPQELTADYELYERFFKHRKPVKKNTSLVKKLVEGKIDLQKPRIENKPFHKRSPVLPTASKPKRRSKLKSSSPFHFGVRGLRINLRKQPLIEVKETFTSSMRRDLDAHSCQKSQKPTYWHGSVEEMEQLKKKIDQRRGHLRNYWRKTDDQRQQRQQQQQQPQPQPQQRRRSRQRLRKVSGDSSNNLQRPRKVSSYCMNDLMVASFNPPTIFPTRVYRSSGFKTKKQIHPRARKSIDESANLVKYRKWRNVTPHPPPPPPRLAKPTPHEGQNFHRVLPIKVVPTFKSILVSGQRDPRITINSLSNDNDAADAAKWFQPPTIPIRHSLTSIMRQRSTNKLGKNARKASPDVIRIAR